MINERPFRIVSGILLITVAVAASMVAFASWQADSAAEAADWGRAISWRPDIALYHMRLGEVNIATNPPFAEKQLRISLRQDPYNPIAAADMATVQLSLRLNQQAHRLTREMARTSSFDERWRYANMYLLQNNLNGFFAETRRACAIADRNVFASVIARALTASDYDFMRVYEVLPRNNDWAAEAFLEAAVEYRQKIAQQAPVAAEGLGFQWLRGLAPTTDPYAERLRQAAAEKYLADLLDHTPADAPGVWREGARAGLFHGPPLAVRGELLMDGAFPHPIPAPDFPAPAASGPTRLREWLRGDTGRVVVDSVETEDRRYPTALALTFDGDEGDHIVIARQVLVGRPGTAVELSAVARSLRRQPSGGVELEVRNRSGAVVARLPVAAPHGWTRSREEFVLPALPAAPPKGPKGSQPERLTPSPIETYQVSIVYRRPLGALPLNNVIALTEVSLQTLPAAKGGSR